MDYVHEVKGRDVGSIILYALSTCGWCKKTKKLLKELGVAYAYIDVDLLDDELSDSVTREMKQWNPDGDFPTLVINNEDCIVGFDEDEIRKALGG